MAISQIDESSKKTYIQNFVGDSEYRISLSNTAIKRILKIRQDNPTVFLRLTILSGGCSGLQSNFDFDNNYSEETDLLVIVNEEILAVIDHISIKSVKNAQIDFINKFGGSFFTLTDLSSSEKCSCGTSFSID